MTITKRHVVPLVLKDKAVEIKTNAKNSTDNTGKVA